MKLPKYRKNPEFLFPNSSEGKVGYALLWLMGIPLPVLLLFYFFFGRG